MERLTEDNFMREYRKRYADFGVERKQLVPHKNMAKKVKKKRNQPKATQSEMAPFQQYWAFRQDQRWTKLPGYMRRVNRRSNEKVFIDTISLILDRLTSHESMKFNPGKIWYETLEKEAAAAKAITEGGEVITDGNDKKDNKKKGGKKKGETAEEIRLRRSEETGKDRIYRDLIKIRNSKEDLKPLLRSMKSPQGRIVLMIELLKQSMDTKGKNLADADSKGKKAETYDILWAVKGLGCEDFTVPLAKAKDLTTKKDASLIYDDYSNVKKLVKQAQEKMNKEEDMIKMQLVDMCDRLPPLTKFSFGFKLDTWQKRVLRWIDAGRSVIVCAPTSSGKTVLSSYVAFPKSKPKSLLTEEEQAEKDEKEKTASKEKKVREKTLTEMENDEEDFLEDDDEDDSESDEEEEDEEEADRRHDEMLSKMTKASLESKQGDDGAKLKAEAHLLGAHSEDFLRCITDISRLDRARRLTLINAAGNYSLNRVLFVVPTEPLVWQVGAYFSKLLKEEGDRATRVAIVTEQLTYQPFSKYDKMPKIVVGTPRDLESALTKSRGQVGILEAYNIASKDIMPGGYDHFDWAIYDEVHALDGEEGEALQRLIRSMSCKFLALSATVGNAEQLRGWMETVKGGQLDVEIVDYKNDGTIAREEEDGADADKLPPPPMSDDNINIHVEFTLETDTRMLDLTSLTLLSTVKDLREAISNEWRQGEDNNSEQFQLFRGDPALSGTQTNPSEHPNEFVDLADDTSTLRDYGFEFSQKLNANLVKVYRHVNLVTHSVRFINLQRYVWDNHKLAEVSPLAAVETVQDLQNGVLDKSSLSFTSKDSYRLWLKLQELYPKDAVAELDPKSFFGVDERITLARTKEYEDHLKEGCKRLAWSYPKESKELLYHFRLEDAEIAELDLAELVLDLKDREMTPCLPFHLNAFEAVRLFQQLLAGMEYRQKVKYPNYYTDEQKAKDAKKAKDKSILKSKGGNKKDEDEAMKEGELTQGESYDVDVFEPHHKFLCGDSCPLNEDELRTLSDEMERYDGFEKRENSAMYNNPGGNVNVMGHALMRGLRRGIGLFIKEVSFPAYRRMVTRLASKGALAVVISDDSLAFGVNMPFRTCIFCGEMIDKESGNSLLTPLMAQQMSGRAGRRGLDTQGNLVYVGSRAKFIRKLMLGEVSNITGQNFEPRYPTLFLQWMLSQRHVGLGRCDTLGQITLFEFVQKHEAKIAALRNGEEPPTTIQIGDAEQFPVNENYALTTSKNVLLKLQLIQEDGEMKAQGYPDIYIPNKDFDFNMPILSLVWALRSNVPESIMVGKLFNELHDAMVPYQTWITETDKERVTKVVNIFLTMLLIMVDRHVCSDEDESFQENSYFQEEGRAALRDQWLEMYASTWESLPAYMRDPVGPYDANGNPTRLDGTMFRALMDRTYQHTLSDAKKQLLKARYWTLGIICRAMHNCIWQLDEEVRVLINPLRNVFKLITYTNGELIRGIVNFENVSDVSLESRTIDARSGRGIAKVIEYSKPWADELSPEVSIPINCLSWCEAIVYAMDRIKIEIGKKDAKTSDDEIIRKVQEKFTMLSPTQKRYSNTRVDRPASVKVSDEGDRLLMHALMNFDEKAVKEQATALHACSAGGKTQGNERYTLGAFVWLVGQHHPALLQRAPLYIHQFYDEELIEAETVVAWADEDNTSFLQYLPHGSIEAQGGSVTEEVIKSVKEKCAPLIANLKEMLEDDDDDDDEESDED